MQFGLSPESKLINRINAWRNFFLPSIPTLPLQIIWVCNFVKSGHWFFEIFYEIASKTIRGNMIWLQMYVSHMRIFMWWTHLRIRYLQELSFGTIWICQNNNSNPKYCVCCHSLRCAPFGNVAIRWWECR